MLTSSRLFSPRSCCGEECSSVHLYPCMYVCGFVRQGFNSVPEVVTMTDADRAATPSSITESARISCSLHANPDVLDGEVGSHPNTIVLFTGDAFWRSSTNQRPVINGGDVSLRFVLHLEACGHRGWDHRADHVFQFLFRCSIHAAQDERVCRTLHA